MSWSEEGSNSKTNSNDSSSSVGTSESHSTSESNQETSSDVSNESTGTTKHTLARKGNQGVNTYAHDMLEFRQLFLNIEQQIINDPELASCFMLIW